MEFLKKKTRFFLKFEHSFHHDGIYFYSHNIICFAPLCHRLYYSGFESFAPLER